ncbi:DUF362 domain-containing protein [Candidatus Woesearchaeota archaeon]|nr:DUF362 domain-containing protein [Candidatus Woesearchaeota archaeon]
MAKVSVLKCESYDVGPVTEVIRRSLKNIGFEVPDNKKILLKPNVLGQRKKEMAITTHPAIIDALCRILKEKRNEVWVGDSGGVSSYGGTKKAFEICGIEAAAKKNGARLISFEGSEKKEIIDDNGKVIKRFFLAKEPFDADLIINVPKLKTHMLTKFTGAVKNMFGCVPGGGKSKKHALAPNEDMFCELLLDVYQNVRPHLNIMDGIVGLEGDGPGSAGTPKKAGLILASEDAVALDIIASGIIGYDPMEIKTTRHAIERGLFTKAGDVEVIGEKGVSVGFRKPKVKQGMASRLPKPLVKLAFNLASIKPYINKEMCKRCRICAEVCPVNAITIDKYPKFNRKRCILCYCCHENCPYNAIGLRPNFLVKIYRKLGNR